VSFDVSIYAGTNRPIGFVMPVGFEMTGKTFELAVQWASGRRVYTTDSGLSVSGQIVTWNYSVEDSRAFPEGRSSYIELQWTAGAVQDSDSGYLTVMPGISND
jgi:hypothetical protein